MQCKQAPELLAAYIADELADSERREVSAHIETCEPCRAELAALQKTWRLLARWPEAEPSPAIGRRLHRRVRWLATWETVFTIEGWRVAFLPAAVGVLLSVGLSALLPYDTLVELCRRLVGHLSPESGAFLIAGAAYGLVPLALAVWLVRRRRPGNSFVRGVEVTLLFLVPIAPYAVIQCRNFPTPALTEFLAGLAIGALLGSLGAGWRWAGRSTSGYPA